MLAYAPLTTILMPDPYDGEAKGVCHALVAMDCDSAQGGKGETCDRLIRRFLEATGGLPPWINTFYLSRDPQRAS